MVIGCIRQLLRFAGVAAGVTYAGLGAAHCAAPWQHLADSGEEFLSPLPLTLVAGAAAAPLVFSPTGLDHALRETAQQSLGGRYRPESLSVWTPHVLLGYSLLGYGVSALVHSCEGERVHSAALQAGVVTLALVGSTKWALGRTWPNAGKDPNAPDRLEHPERAQRFRPFENALGAFPSGHTAVSFALAAAVRTSGASLGVYRYLGYPISTAVGYLMWFGDHHWASDVISGALLGEAVGSSVGKAFAPKAKESSWTLLPLPGRGAAISISGAW